MLQMNRSRAVKGKITLITVSLLLIDRHIPSTHYNLNRKQSLSVKTICAKEEDCFKCLLATYFLPSPMLNTRRFYGQSGVFKDFDVHTTGHRFYFRPSEAPG